MVEGARLEILCTPCGYRGFKSLPLRQLIKTVCPEAYALGFIFCDGVKGARVYMERYTKTLIKR